MLVLVTGGSGSGKSAFAESVIQSLEGNNRLYIATMHPYDKESFARIDRHRAMRAGKGFDTLECYTHLDRVSLDPDMDVLLECMSNLTANEIWEPDGAGFDGTVDAILAGVDHVAGTVRNLVIVTNEIFSDGIPYPEETRRYQEILGQINSAIASRADRVVEVVYGIPLELKK